LRGGPLREQKGERAKQQRGAHGAVIAVNSGHDAFDGTDGAKEGRLLPGYGGNDTQVDI
jgi:hypothetical protein